MGGVYGYAFNMVERIKNLDTEGITRNAFAHHRFRIGLSTDLLLRATNAFSVNGGYQIHLQTKASPTELDKLHQPWVRGSWGFVGFLD